VFPQNGEGQELNVASKTGCDRGLRQNSTKYTPPIWELQPGERGGQKGTRDVLELVMTAMEQAQGLLRQRQRGRQSDHRVEVILSLLSRAKAWVRPRQVINLR